MKICSKRTFKKAKVKFDDAKKLVQSAITNLENNRIKFIIKEREFTKVLD